MEPRSKTVTPDSSVAPDAKSVSSGATWQRIDLHLHSPGVESFSCPNGSDVRSQGGRAQVVKQYVSQLESQGIKLCALTDYNGIRSEWFLAIQEEARRRGITVLPGAELSFRVGKHGMHILAIFDSYAKIEEINSVILALDRDAGTPLFGDDRGHRDIDLKDNLPDALRALRERFGCLLIPPHPDQDNGICKTLQPSDAAKLLASMKPDAIEHCPDTELKRLKSTGILDEKFLQGISRVEFSDPKRIEEIGTKHRQDGTLRATYLKLSSTELDALRLALHDPETRLCVGNLRQSRHPRIRSMEVMGSGFLGNLAIAWNDDLNAVIGGRGAGKSAILESLRYALGLEPYSEHAHREDLVRHAVGSGGKITVVLERPIGDGKTRPYRVTRVFGEDPKVCEFDSDSLVTVSPSDLFGLAGGPTIFGQREIYAVSSSEEYRLNLLDDLIGDEARQLALSVRESGEQLRINGRAILEGKRNLSKREDHRQRLKTIEYEISVYEKHAVAEKLREATALSSDGQHLKNSSDALTKARRTWEEIKDRIAVPIANAARDLRKGQSTQKAILEEASSALLNLEKGLRELYRSGDALFNSASEALSRLGLRWKEALGPLEEDLNKIKQEAHAEALDPDRLLRLTEERAALGPLMEELDRGEQDLKSLLERRSILVQTLQDRRLGEHKLRRERAEAISATLGGRLRLTVEFKGQKEEYRLRLISLLKGSGVSTDAIERLTIPEATDGIALAKSVRAGSTDVQARFDLTPGMADRLVRWLGENEVRLLDLETLIPSDALRVELHADQEYRPLDRLSVGQRATAILLLLFALEGRVLILDQPEDDLDNRFVYEDIVTLLREQKGLDDSSQRRQIIAATHNANIPVIGDAELVLALEAREGRVHVMTRASIDDTKTRQIIKQMMEGGEEAFLKRAEKYGGV